MIIWEMSTASNAKPGTVLSSLKTSLSQRGSGAPEMNQELPLSARISPYLCMATRMTWTSGEKPDVSKFALSRNRWPIGGKVGDAELEASWRAGQTWAAWVWSAVKRIA